MIALAGAIALRDVRTIDGEAGDDLAEPVPQSVEREVARVQVALRDAVELVGEHLKLAGQRDAKDQALVVVDQIFVRSAVAGPRLVELRERLLAGGVNAQTVDQV